MLIYKEHFEIIKNHLRHVRIEHFGYNSQDVQKKLKIGLKEIEKMMQDGTLPLNRFEKFSIGYKIKYFSEKVVKRISEEMR